MKKSNGLHTKNTSVNSIKKQCSISVRNKNNIKQNNPLNTDLGKKEREKLFNIYLEGLQWILCYYYYGLKSWK